jgi:hypothetical protein
MAGLLALPIGVVWRQFAQLRAVRASIIGRRRRPALISWLAAKTFTGIVHDHA